MSNDQTRATLEAALAKSRAAGAGSGAATDAAALGCTCPSGDGSLRSPCPVHSSALTFAALRQANTMRLPLFKNPHGQLAHSMPDGSDWSPAQWLQAVIGELGEYANFRKKFERGDLTADQFAVHAGKELADVQTYLDILARRCLDVTGNPHPNGINLGESTRRKFNEVSERVGADVFIGANGRVGLQSNRRFWSVEAGTLPVPCQHDWPDKDGQTDSDGSCTKCGMSFQRYIHTECP